MKGALLVVAFLQSAAAWDAADVATRRLSPDEFKDLPALVRAEAKRRGCTVPQVAHGGPAEEISTPHNVTRGRFRGPTVDWALLCSRDRVSSILVCGASAPLRCEELAPSPDRGWLQTIDRGVTMRFSRLLGIAPKGSARGGVALPRDGIVDAFVEKASSAWSWQDGHWLEIPWDD